MKIVKIKFKELQKNFVCGTTKQDIFTPAKVLKSHKKLFLIVLFVSLKNRPVGEVVTVWGLILELVELDTVALSSLPLRRFFGAMLPWR